MVAALALGVPVAGPAAAAPTPATAPTPIAFPTRAGGSETALIVAPTAARRAPGAGGRAIAHLRGETTWSHQPQVLLVLGSASADGQEWLKVLLPVRPTGTVGWIPRNHAALRHDPFWIELLKGARRLRVFREGRFVFGTRAVIGKAATPTPAGLAAVYERNRQPDPAGFLGPWALPLTALSNVLRNFGGGPGRIAIHGRDGASLLDPLGSARSHGCIRIDDWAIRRLARHVAPGTPVRIVG